MYVKLIIVLRFLWIFEECFAIKFVPVTKLRRLKFLRDPSVHGESELMQNLMDDIDMDAIDGGQEMLRGQVLGGDFFPIIASNENNEDDNLGPSPEKPDEEPEDLSYRALKPLNDAFKNALEKLPEPLQKIVIIFRNKFQKQMTALMELIKKDESPERLALELACNSKKDNCLGVSEFGQRCMIDCLTKNNKMVNKYSGHIARVMNELCAPIGTAFATVIEKMGSSGSPVEAYLTAVKSSPGQTWSSARMGADSLTYLMVTGVATSCLPLGIVAEEMKGLMSNKTAPVKEKDVTAQGLNNSTPPMLGNPLCIPRILVDESFQMAQIMERDPNMMDVILPGFNTVVNMVKYVPGDHQPFYSGYLEAFEIMTGMSCGLINRVEGGGPTECNHIGGFPRPGVRMPANVKRSLPDWEPHCSGIHGESPPSSEELPPTEPPANPETDPPPPPPEGTPPAPPDESPPEPAPMPPAGRSLPATAKLPQSNIIRGKRQYRS